MDEAASNSPASEPVWTAALAGDPTGSQLSDAEWLSWARRAEELPSLGRLGEYELLVEIGHGAQGTVYKARQPGTRREIVIKRLAAGAFATPSMRARFDREIEILGTLRHPHVVTVYGAERVDGQLLLAMEWVDGVPVDRWAAGADGARRSVREILAVLCQICDAVRHAHQRGVIHRDLKPSNILVDGDGRARVLDFGLAKLTAADAAVAAFQTVGTGFMGTPAYASPEQLRGQFDDVDVRSDVYSLGVIAYQLLTGVLPYPAQTSITGLFESILHVEPKRPSLRRRELGSEVDAIVLKALAKDVERRYQSVDALADDLHRFLTGQTVTAHPPSTIYRVRKVVGRHRTAAAMVLALALVLFGATVVSVILMLRAEDARRIAQAAQSSESQQRGIAERSAAAAATAEDEATYLAYLANLHAAESALRLDDVIGARSHLDRAPEALRGWEWFHLRQRTDRSARRWTLPVPGHMTVSMALSPDGRTLAIGASDGMVRLVDANSLELLREFKVLRAWVVAMAFAPDGSTLYVSAGHTQAARSTRRQLRGWNVATGTPAGPEFLGHGDTARQIMLTADGAQLVTASFDNTIRIWDTATGEALSRVDCAPDGLAAVALDPSEQWVAYATAAGAIRILDLSTGALMNELPAGSLVNSLAFSPDGSALAVGGEDSVIRLWEWRSARRGHELHGHTGPIRALRFEHDGAHLVSGAEDCSLRIWRLADGREVGKCLGHTSWVTDVIFSQDGSRLYSVADEASLRVWSMPTEDVRTLEGYYGWRPVAAFAPDGACVAVGARSANPQSVPHTGAVVVHDMRTDTERFSIECPYGVNAVAFSPDSRQIAIGPTDDRTTVAIHDTVDGRRKFTLGGHDAGVNAVTYSPDGELLAVGGGGVQLWAGLADEPAIVNTLALEQDSLTTAAFHPDGRLFTAWASGTLVVWDARSSRILNRLPTNERGGLISIAFSPDGDALFAIGPHDARVTIWDAHSLKYIGALTGLTSRATAIAVSPDGLRVAASDNYGAIKLFDVPTGREVATLHGHRGRALALAFSPDGRWLLSAAADWTVRMWQGPRLAGAQRGDGS